MKGGEEGRRGRGERGEGEDEERVGRGEGGGGGGEGRWGGGGGERGRKEGLPTRVLHLYHTFNFECRLKFTSYS